MMIQKYILSIVSIILIGISLINCKNSTTALEGTWVENYTKRHGYTNKEYKDYIHLLDFKNNKVRMKSFYSKTSEKHLDTIVKFTLADNMIRFGDDQNNPIKITKDSIVLSMLDDNDTLSIVYKKIPVRKQKLDWNPTGKEYKLTFKNEYQYLDFVSDTKLHSFRSDITGFVYAFDWRLETINNQMMLIKEYRNDVIFVTVDSLERDKVYTTNYFMDIQTEVYEKQKSEHTKPSVLYGLWKPVLNSGKVVKEETKRRTVLGNDFDKLRIQEDSIHIENGPYSSWSDTWKFYENIQVMTLNESEKAFRVTKVTKDTLVLHMNISKYTHLYKEVVFVRE